MVAGQALPGFWSELGELSIGVQAQAPMQLPPLHPRARSFLNRCPPSKCGVTDARIVATILLPN